MLAKDLRVGISLLTCNTEERHYRATEWAVRSLLASDVGAYDWYLQVLDNGSTEPHTVPFLRRLVEDNPTRMDGVVFAENLGIAKGRNLSFQRLRERWDPEFFVEIHTDHLFPQEWFRPLSYTMALFPQVGLLGPGLISGRPIGDWALDTVDLNAYPDYYEAMARLEIMARVNRQHFLARGLTHPVVKRATMLAEIGPYDEGMPGLTNFEDTEEAFRAVQAGWECRIDFGSVVWHHYTYSRMDVRGWDGNNQDFGGNLDYCVQKHGQAFYTFATETLGGWMDEAYQRRKAL